MKTDINKLNEIDKTKNPFKVPENYFAQVNDEIMRRLPEKESVVPHTIPLWEKVKPWVYMAAMFMGIYITINFLTRDSAREQITTEQTAVQERADMSQTENNFWSTVQVTEEEFYQYLEEQIVEDGYYDYMYNQYYLN